MAAVDEFYKKVKDFTQRKGYEKIDVFLDEIGKIKRSTYYDRQKKNAFPPADVILCIAEKMNVSCDYLIAGYDRNPLVHKYDSLLKNLEDLDASALRHVEVMVAGLAEDCRKKNMENHLTG